jgi:Kef-type K+ transport system membrane component KefB
LACLSVGLIPGNRPVILLPLILTYREKLVFTFTGSIIILSIDSCQHHRTLMTPFLQLLLLLAIILLLAKIGGYISIRLHQPSVLGELIVGLILGPSLINILHQPLFESLILEEVISEMAEMGVLLLMFVAGLELHLSELMRNVKVSALAGILGVAAPVSLGWGIGVLAGFEPNHALFLGLTMGATSVSISAQTLMELKVLRSRVGLGLLGAAVFDDVLVILLLSSFLALIGGSGGFADVMVIFFRMLIFLALSLLLGIYVLPRLVRLIAPLPISQGILTLALVVMFFYGVASEIVGGMAAITGSFLAGLMFARSPEKERLERGISPLAYGLFVPIFFVHIGLEVDIGVLQKGAYMLVIGIIVSAILGKLLGAGLGARLAGFSWIESFQLGAGMVSRGEVGLILASVGLKEGLLASREFSAVVAVVLFSTLLTPPLLRYLFSYEKKRIHVPDPVQLEEVN